MMPISLLMADYQLEHMQEVLTVYRMSIIKKLQEPFKSKAKKQFLLNKLDLTDEVADGINMLESEVCNHHDR